MFQTLGALTGLQVERAGAWRTIDDIDDFGISRVAYVKRTDHVGYTVPDIGMAALYHDLDAVRFTAEVGVCHEADVLRCYSLHCHPY
jgi:hypothetical protein